MFLLVVINVFLFIDNSSNTNSINNTIDFLQPATYKSWIERNLSYEPKKGSENRFWAHISGKKDNYIQFYFAAINS